MTGRRKSDRGKSIRAASGVRVLAVDDDPAYLRYLKLVLSRAGFDVTITSDGKTAIDRVHHDQAIGLLLVDLVMPEMDGIETLRVLRKDHESDRLYTILLTAHDSSETKLRAFNSGFDDFLSKIAPESEIVAKVRSAVRRLDMERRLHTENEALQTLALTDELTGIANRRALFRSGEEFLAAGRKLSVVVFDLDHFKQINDTYGHPAGDRILAAVAACLKENTRVGDIIARYGGDEFMLLLPDTDAESARMIAGRVRRSVRAQMTDGISADVAWGVSCGGQTTIDELIAAADRDLYASRSRQRTRLAARAEPVRLRH
jgi:two-component system cell cycle response regulator